MNFSTFTKLTETEQTGVEMFHAELINSITINILAVEMGKGTMLVFIKF